MIFHPAILALYVSSVLIVFMVLYSAYYGVQILRHWDIESGSEQQLILERKTYLISTLLTYILAFELLSLFLYVFTADQLPHLLCGRHVRGGVALRQRVRLSRPLGEGCHVLAGRPLAHH